MPNCKKKPPNDRTLTMREFMLMLGDLKLVDGKIISSKDIVDVLSCDNALVCDASGCYNLELEVTYFDILF